MQSFRRLAVLVSTVGAWAAIMPAMAPARSQTKVTIRGKTITITGTIKEPVDKPPLSIMIFDSRSVSALDSKRCDARPNADGEMPWVIHTTRRLTPPGRYSVELIWFAHHKIIHRSETFSIPFAISPPPRTQLYSICATLPDSFSRHPPQRYQAVSA